MASRVNRITVELEVYVEFEGVHTAKFSYTPADDDPFVAEALRKNRASLEAQVAAAPPASDIFIL